MGLRACVLRRVAEDVPTVFTIAVGPVRPQKELGVHY